MPGMPDYGRPPVVEVAVGIQFAPLSELTATHLGLYWSTIRDEFPDTAEHPPLAHVVENVSEEQPSSGPRIEILDRPELVRTWFIGHEGRHVIQVQRDRFVHNWRKMKEDDAYPRFPSVSDSFFLHWQTFKAFLTENHLSGPQTDQCELTYVNRLRRGDGWESLDELSDIFACLKWRTRTGFLPIPENLQWAMRFLLPDGAGRLRVEATPVRMQPDNALAIRFALTARGAPAGEPSDEALARWFGMAHEWVVKGFADLVDDKTDALWEKKA